MSCDVFHLLVILAIGLCRNIFTTLLSSKVNSISLQALTVVSFLGNADGIGHIRKHELVDSAQVLGLDIGSNPSAVVSVLDDPRFPDSITTDWSTTEVRDVLLNVWTTRPFDTIITFDEDGVSGHPNHRALYHGAIAFVNSVRGSQAKDGSDSGNPVALYTLPSYGLIRKYSGVLDIITTFATKGRGAVSPVVTGKLPTKVPSLPPVVLSINGPQQYRSAREAMVKAHKSQMRWFRWGWISLSRYMFVNDLHLYGQVERPKIESVTV